MMTDEFEELPQLHIKKVVVNFAQRYVAVAAYDGHFSISQVCIFISSPTNWLFS